MPKQQPRSVGISSLQALDEVANGSSAFKLGERTGRAVAAGGTVEEDFPASAASICHDASPMGPKKKPTAHARKQFERDRRGQRGIVRRESVRRSGDNSHAAGTIGGSRLQEWN